MSLNGTKTPENFTHISETCAFLTLILPYLVMYHNQIYGNYSMCANWLTNYKYDRPCVLWQIQKQKCNFCLSAQTALILDLPLSYSYFYLLKRGSIHSLFLISSSRKMTLKQEIHLLLLLSVPGTSTVRKLLEGVCHRTSHSQKVKLWEA